MENPPWLKLFLKERRSPKWESLSWATVRSLNSSANDILAKGSPELINDTRMRWTAAQRSVGVELDAPDFVVDRTTLHDFSFIVLGDPGEADASQYIVVEALLAKGEGSAFMVICSDVVYPAGNVNDYVNAFYVPYRRYGGEIFAVPGNHDWYDGLNGFMYHFCGAEALAPTRYSGASFSLRHRLSRAVWKRADAPDRATLLTFRNRMQNGSGPPDKPWRPVQPGPYFAIETARLLIVGIDTGVTGELDREQGDWLRRISKHPKPKILLTGKPINVDNERRECAIQDDPACSDRDGKDDPACSDRDGKTWPTFPEQLRTVDEIVRCREHNYVAVIGGDVHNYQRYAEDTRTIHSLVSGGGGAYLSSTYRIPFDPKNDAEA